MRSQGKTTKPNRRGTSAGRRVLRAIRAVIGTRINSKGRSMRGINHDNLINLVPAAISKPSTSSENIATPIPIVVRKRLPQEPARPAMSNIAN